MAYVKRFDDGVIFYMEEASKKRRDLRGISMRKYPSTIDTDRVLAIATNPNLYVRNGERAYGDDTTAAPLFQDMTAEQAQFAETEAAYGGREAYEAAKAEGRTELDYRQWVQVRTPAFKEWFGDWENDPENASKVVNPNTGEPLVVYHGATKGSEKLFLGMRDDLPLGKYKDVSHTSDIEVFENARAERHDEKPAYPGRR